MYERIKELCRKHGITVTELERATGLSRGSICKVGNFWRFLRDGGKPWFFRVNAWFSGSIPLPNNAA